ncbi:MAG: amidohydrolase family protein, partial [Bacteroidota bacterium]
MKRTFLLLWLGSVLIFGSLWAQETFPINGIQDERTHATAFTNVTLHIAPGRIIENATLVIREEKIVAAGTNVPLPADATVMDMKGKHIYPSFIDPHTHYGMPEVKRAPRSRNRTEQISPKTEGAYNANDAIKAQFDAISLFKGDEKFAKEMRNMGFGSVLTFRPDGIARGTSALVSLSNDNPNLTVIKGKASAHYSFNKGSSAQDYPSSIMGAIALLRQTYMDADWYGSQPHKKLYDESLRAWMATQEMPQVFEVRGKLNLMRADKVGDEFGKQYIIKCSGDTYQNLAEVKATGASLILPVNFPQAYDVTDPYDAMQVSLGQMKHWEMAPANPKILAENDITFAFTTDDLKHKKRFFPNIRKAIQHGLDKETALAALTTIPANMLQVSDMLGSLESGKIANLIITSGDIFDAKTKIYQNWVQGKPFVVNPLPEDDVRGTYELAVGELSFGLMIEGEPNKFKYTVTTNDTVKLPTTGAFKDGWLSLSFPEKKGAKEVIRIAGWHKDQMMKGEGQLANGTWISWSAKYIGETEKNQKQDRKRPDEAMTMGEVIYPFKAFGVAKLPTAEDILFQNATVWTNESEGVLENTDVLVRDGKIAKVGTKLRAGKARVVDATGMHLSAGIIDEHSHIALSGVNDVATVSSMVRMKD